MVKFKPSRDIPKFIRELRTFSPTEIAKKILSDRNTVRTPESITMWLNRNEKIYNQLKNEIIESEVDNLVVVDSIFVNGTFEELTSVSKWKKDMKRRKISSPKRNIATLKQICKASFPKHKIEIPDWSLKHPDRLTQENVLEVIDILEEAGCDTSNYRLIARNFLMSGNKPYRDISGAKSTSFGKHADLYVEKPILTRMLTWQRHQNFMGFVASQFMFKTGTRLSATLNVLIENRFKIEGINYVYVFDKGRRSKHPEGKRWRKYLPDDLFGNLLVLIGNRKEGKIFEGLEADVLSKLNRDSLKKFCPALEKKIRMPNHFWRHMFAQHMLRATGWKYGVVASLGGWTVKALEESYGKPPVEQVKEWGLEFIPKI